MFEQVAGEVGAVLTGEPSERTRDLFGLVAVHLQVPQGRQCERYPTAHAWLKVKEALLDEDFDTFVERASRFLGAGPRDNAMLWYATAADMAIWFGELGFRDTERVRRVITEDAAGWPGGHGRSAWHSKAPNTRRRE